MNCQTFQNIVGDLVRDGLIDAVARQDGLTHAEECGDCEVRLIAERELEAGLRSLAAADAGLTAPARMESALLQAFRATHSEATPVSKHVCPAVPSPRRSYPWYAGAIAASVAMIMAASLMWWKDRPAGDGGTIAQAPPYTGEKRPVEASVNGPDTPVRTELRDESEPDYLVSRPSASPVKGRSGRSRRSVSINRNDVAAENRMPDEIMTDFIPVSYASAGSPIVSGRLVRVEMPRSALASFGLSVNAAQANERVRADVLMDEFGTAQAVRFVK